MCVHPVRLAQVVRGRGKRWEWSRGGVTTSCLKCTVNRSCLYQINTVQNTGGGFTLPDRNLSLVELLQCGLQNETAFLCSLFVLRCFRGVLRENDNNSTSFTTEKKCFANG